jgi:light-regulated signal transduction histidine kinase (bacteriophytochrome)
MEDRLRELNETLERRVIERTEALELRAAELFRVNRELERSNAELDAFSYAASHDLKEPLRGIHNYAELIQRSAASRLSISENSKLESIKRFARRMDDLVNGLFYYSQVGRIDLGLELTDLNSVAQECVDLLNASASHPGVRVSLNPLPFITCDRVRVREVFTNLVMNALKYNDKEERRVEIGHEEGPVPAFYVRDNGIGIAPEHREIIFGIFKRLHGRDDYGGGTGAGLTIARRAIERHGGRMWVESELGKGSTFYFTLSGEELG